MARRSPWKMGIAARIRRQLTTLRPTDDSSPEHGRESGIRCLHCTRRGHGLRTARLLPRLDRIALRAGIALFVVALWAGTATAQFTVTSATDDGTGNTAGSLSAAINAANANAIANPNSVNTIDINLASGTTITLAGNLPPIDCNLTINGALVHWADDQRCRAERGLLRRQRHGDDQESHDRECQRRWRCGRQRRRWRRWRLGAGGRRSSTTRQTSRCKM